MRQWNWLLGLIVFGMSLSPAWAGDKIQVLVFTGGHEFDNKEFFSVFDGMENVEYKNLVQPKANEAFVDGTAEQADVVVLYDMWQKINPEQKEGFLDYLNSGKGLVVMHHALASYVEWSDYLDVAGGKYVLNKEGETIGGKHFPSSTYKHDVEMKIEVADENHPITKGLDDFEIVDETYGKLYYQDDIHVLLKNGHPTGSPNVAWVSPHPKARVAVIQLGHDKKAFLNKHFQMLVENAVKWAAE